MCLFGKELLEIFLKFYFGLFGLKIISFIKNFILFAFTSWVWERKEKVIDIHITITKKKNSFSVLMSSIWWDEFYWCVFYPLFCWKRKIRFEKKSFLGLILYFCVGLRVFWVEKLIYWCSKSVFRYL